MSATLDTDVAALTTAVATVAADLTAQANIINEGVAAIQGLTAQLANAGTVNPADLTAIEAATSSLAAAATAITSSGSTLSAALPPVPAPAPAPAPAS